MSTLQNNPENFQTEKPMLEWNDELVSKFWNFWSQYPEQYFTFQFGRQIAKRLEKFLVNKKRILDYGCGNGFLLEQLLEFGSDVSGLDFSEKSVKSVKDRLSGRPHFKGAFLNTEVSKLTAKFDALIAIEVIEHLNDTYLNQMMTDIKNLLEPNGLVIITTPNDEDLSESQVYCPLSNKVFHRWQHVRSWSESSIRNFMTSQNFEVTNIFTTDFSVPLNFSPKNLVKRAVRAFRNSKLPHLVCIARKK